MLSPHIGVALRNEGIVVIDPAEQPSIQQQFDDWPEHLKYGIRGYCSCNDDGKLDFGWLGKITGVEPGPWADVNVGAAITGVLKGLNVPHTWPVDQRYSILLGV